MCSPCSPTAAAPARRWSASPPSTARARSRYARDKLARKRLDAIVLNDVVATPGSASTRRRTRSRVVTPAGDHHLPRAAKARHRGRHPGHALERSFIYRGQGAALKWNPRSPHPRPRPSPPRRSRRRSSMAQRIADNIRRAVKVRDEVLNHALVALAGRGAHPRRGLPGRRQDRARARARAPRSTASSRACSARPTCCRPTSSAPTSTTSARAASSSGPARSSPTS